MTYLTRFRPFNHFGGLESQVNRVVREFNRASDELFTGGSFVPAADIYEDEHSITLKLEVPGMGEKDLDIRLENRTLTVRGERKFEQEEKEENFQRIERSYGWFAHSFTLPDTVSGENVQAGYENGVLKITLAKREEAKPRQIKVTASPAGKPIAGEKSQAA